MSGNMPIEPIVYGGLKVDKNMIASRRKEPNGEYVIDFKNGQSIRYKDQTPNGFARIYLSEGFGKIEFGKTPHDRNVMTAENLFGAVITGSEGIDAIQLIDGCKHNTVKVNNDTNYDLVDIYGENNHGNKVLLGDDDVLLYDKAKDASIVGPDTFDQKNFDINF